MKIINYNKFAQKLYEQALNKNIINKFNNYLNDIDSLDYNIRNEIKILKTYLIDIDYNEIFVGKQKNIDNKNIFKISNFGKKITAQINLINNAITYIENEKIKEDLIDFFEENYIDSYIEIEIEPDNFNRIHIPNGLPSHFQGIGLSTKIYKAIMKKINYISSDDSSGYLNYASKFIWEKLAYDVDCYTNLSNRKILSFNTNCSKSIIKNILNEFIKTSNTKDIIIDPEIINLNLNLNN